MRSRRVHGNRIKQAAPGPKRRWNIMKKTMIIVLTVLMLLGMCACAAQAEQAAAACEHNWTAVDGTSHQCSLCLEMGEHRLEPKTTAPTCSSVGYTMDTCKDCGHTGAQYDIRPANKDAHVWGGWTTEKESTCTEQGSRSRSCTICTGMQTEKTPLAEHAWKSETIAPSCKADGYTVDVCTVCKKEGDKTDIVPRSAAYHKWGEFAVTVKPDCEESGSQERTCSVCGASHRQEIPALGHQPETVTVAPELCKDGYTVEKCALCGIEMSERTDIVPAAHMWGEWTVVTEPLCLTDGEQMRECQKCRKQETGVVPAKGHDFKEGTRQPTCVSDGYTAVVCAACGEMQGEPYDIVPGGSDYHVWDNDRWEREAEPTCTQWGLYWQGCKYCEYMKKVPIMPSGHKSVVVTFEPDFVTDGYTVRICSVCGGEDGARYDIVPAGMYSVPMQEMQVSDREFSGVESAVLYTAASESGEKAAVLEVRADASGIVEMDFSDSWFAENHIVRVVIARGDVRLTVAAEGILHAEIASEKDAEGLLVTVLANVPADGFDEAAGEYDMGVYSAALPENGPGSFSGRCMSISTPAGPGTLLVVSTAKGM